MWNFGWESLSNSKDATKIVRKRRNETNRKGIRQVNKMSQEVPFICSIAVGTKDFLYLDVRQKGDDIRFPLGSFTKQLFSWCFLLLLIGFTSIFSRMMSIVPSLIHFRLMASLFYAKILCRVRLTIRKSIRVLQ